MWWSRFAWSLCQLWPFERITSSQSSTKNRYEYSITVHLVVGVSIWQPGRRNLLIRKTWNRYPNLHQSITDPSDDWAQAPLQRNRLSMSKCTFAAKTGCWQDAERRPHHHYDSRGLFRREASAMHRQASALAACLRMGHARHRKLSRTNPEVRCLFEKHSESYQESLTSLGLVQGSYRSGQTLRRNNLLWWWEPHVEDFQTLNLS